MRVHCGVFEMRSMAPVWRAGRLDGNFDLLYFLVKYLFTVIASARRS
jgi:hypothetical protein